MTDSNYRPRLLVAKVGLDGHDRGVKVVARTLRDAGFEVIYTGFRQTPEQVVDAALQEDVAGIGVSILSGAHRVLLPALAAQLRQRGGADICPFAGGIVPDADVATLKAAGVEEIFGPGTQLTDITRWAERRFVPVMA